MCMCVGITLLRNSYTYILPLPAGFWCARQTKRKSAVYHAASLRAAGMEFPPFAMVHPFDPFCVLCRRDAPDSSRIIPAAIAKIALWQRSVINSATSVARKPVFAARPPARPSPPRLPTAIYALIIRPFPFGSPARFVMFKFSRNESHEKFSHVVIARRVLIDGRIYIEPDNLIRARSGDTSRADEIHRVRVTRVSSSLAFSLGILVCPTARVLIRITRYLNGSRICKRYSSRLNRTYDRSNEDPITLLSLPIAEACV